MRPTVLLFDIDGTLLDTGGAGRRAMVGAFTEVTGRSDACANIAFAGMTDRAIARQGLTAAGREPTPALIDTLLDAYLARLERELVVSHRYRVMPGVQALLARLATEARVAIGLGTGNVRRGAFRKLARGGLDAPFAFGGFGCDAEDRAELLRVGATRGAGALGATLDECRVVVIGDTPKDVAAALAIGAECVGVGTGSFAAAALVEVGARHGFHTLEHEGVGAALLARPLSAARS